MKDFLKKYRIEILIFSIALALRLFLFAINFDASNSDLLGTIHGDDGYFELSQGLLAGNGFSWDMKEPFLPNALRTPLYIYFISGILFLFKSYWVVICTQIILGALIPVLGRYLALQIVTSKKIGLWVGMMLSFEPYLVLFSSIFYTETLFIFLFLVFLILFIKYLEVGTIRPLAWGSFALGLATLTKTTVQYLPLILVILIMWNFQKKFARKKLLLHSFIFMVIFLGTLAPWLYRNYSEFGVVGMTAQPAYNLNVYLVPSVLSLENGTSLSEEVNKFVTIEESSGNKITLANSPLYKKRAFDVLRDHPVGLLHSMGITVVTFFTHDGMLTVLQHAGYVPDTYIGKPALSLLLSSPVEFLRTIFKYVQTPIVLVLIMRLVWIGITLFFLIGFFQFLKRSKCDVVSIFILVTILYFVATSAIGGLGVNARYRMPVNPIIFTFAITGFVYVRNVILAKYKK